MTGEKIIEVTLIYQRLFEELGIKAEEMSHELTLQEPEEALAHCYSMLPKIKEFVKKERLGKAFRWLGFIQGVLFATGQHNLDSLKEHNKPRE